MFMKTETTSKKLSEIIHFSSSKHNKTIIVKNENLITIRYN